ncbi:hypothetical protein ABW20_dc0104622 [Dactylellina cionopaga]|nr:hypothetical protein ABW20_dc0104622 [Dactylellina cionopaga]
MLLRRQLLRTTTTPLRQLTFATATATAPHFGLPIAAPFRRNFQISNKMSSKQAVLTDKAPPPFPVYSQAVVHDKTVYVSGQLGMDPKTKALLEGPIGLRADLALKNMSAVLDAAGSSMDKVLKVVVFLTDMKDFSAVNDVYINYFGDVKPARSCIAVHQLPLGTDVEIECVAHL